MVTTLYRFGEGFFVPAFDDYLDNPEKIYLHQAISAINGKIYMLYYESVQSVTESSKNERYAAVFIFRKDDRTHHITDVLPSDDIPAASIVEVCTLLICKK
jgi:hypothetical protein